MSIVADRLEPDADALMAHARHTTGLEDFGPYDFANETAVQLRYMREEGNLTAEGMQRSLQSMVRHMSTRLRMQDFFARHPEIEDQKIVAPVIIIGLQRTGTSKLFRNVAADAQWNVLYTWQALNPIPPASWEPGLPDPRLAEAEAFCEQQKFMARAHKFEARAPEMEAMLMSQTFMVNSGQYLIPSHHKWLETEDFTPLYRHLERQLKFLQWQNRSTPGKRWILKSPAHLLALETARQVFPDAKFVMTHRHPASSVGSMCKLVEITQETVARSIDRAMIGQSWLGIMSHSIDNFMALRAREGDDAVIDISFRDLVGDPLPAIRRIYDFAGMPYTAETEAAAARWHDENPQHSEGKFEYDLADFGLDRARIDAAFHDYIQAYSALL